jgi:hypothetical protein
MPRVVLAQQYFGLFDEGVEDAMYDRSRSVVRWYFGRVARRSRPGRAAHQITF